MILPFSTQFNGKPTYFVEKIHRSISPLLFERDPSGDRICAEHLPIDYNQVFFAYCSPKHHTIREDKNDRWKAGNKIDFFINCRQKDMFRFAPVLPVVSVQKIEIKWSSCKSQARIFIDNNDFATFKNHNDNFGFRDLQYPNNKKPQGLSLVVNDGFETIEDFVAYFENDFTGKIIHWTNLKY